MLRLLSLALVLAVGVPASPQGLGEAAKKEKERREGKKGGETPVITEEELKNADGKSVALPPSGAKAASPSPPGGWRAASRPADSGDSPSDEAIMRQRAEHLRSQMRTCESQVASAERQLKQAEEVAWRNGSSYSSTKLVEYYRGRRDDAKRRCDAIEDDARQRGIPAGYLR